MEVLLFFIFAQWSSRGKIAGKNSTGNLLPFSKQEVMSSDSKNFTISDVKPQRFLKFLCLGIISCFETERDLQDLPVKGKHTVANSMSFGGLNLGTHFLQGNQYLFSEAVPRALNFNVLIGF